MQETKILTEAKKWLDIYFSGEDPTFTPPLHPSGSAFRQAVWQILLQIPYGQTITYGEIARRVAEMQQLSHMSAQAVGGAVGHNKVSIIIPCHRVVGANGSLTGYAGGLDKKIALLELEHADMSRLFIPGKHCTVACIGSLSVCARQLIETAVYQTYARRFDKRAGANHSLLLDYLLLLITSLAISASSPADNFPSICSKSYWMPSLFQLTL